METKLLPCPICGGEAKLDEHCDKYVVFCTSEKCSWHDTEAEAVEAWNTRHERTCHVEGSYYDELMDEDYTDLSCGHHLRGAAWEFDFCPVCGARVKEDADAE